MNFESRIIVDGYNAPENHKWVGDQYLTENSKDSKNWQMRNCKSLCNIIKDGTLPRISHSHGFEFGVGFHHIIQKIQKV